MRLSPRLAPELRLALLLLALGAGLRLPMLGSNPPGLFRDEAEKVYTAWSLGRTGGYHRPAMVSAGGGEASPALIWTGPPLVVDAWGSHISAIYHWLDVPFALLLGPTAWAARWPAALAGLLTLWAVWRFARRAWDAEVALLALFFLAISPWHVLFSRWAQQGILVPLWLALALWLFERGRLAAGRPWWLAGVALGLAFTTYEPARLQVPLFLVALAWAHRQDLSRNRPMALLALLAFLVTVTPIGLWLGFHRAEGLARWGRVSILAREGATPLSVASEFVGNYLRHLSIPFLFLRGDANLRHSVPGFGQMHWIELPGLLAALLLAFTQRRPQDLTVALWFLLAPVAPSLTTESPHALRAIASLPAAPVLSAFGTAALFRGLMRWVHAAPPRQRWIQPLQAWGRENIDLIRMAGLTLGGVTATLFALQLHLRYPALSAEAWEAGLHSALREAAPFAAAGQPVLVTTGQRGREVLYLATHLRVALRTDPAALPSVAPLLPPPWFQIPAPPEILWERSGGSLGASVLVVQPGEIPQHPPDIVIWGPANRFTPPRRALWEIHAGQGARLAVPWHTPASR